MAQYHFHVRVATRKSGKTASAKHRYNCREGRYAEGERGAELVFIKSGNMPKWAKDAGDYWRAADQHERENGTRCRYATLALPRELSTQQNIELARQIASALFDDDKLPYTIAFHDKPGNPHLHIMYSERALDGHNRNPRKWFKRFNAKRPERGGARKLKHVEQKHWLRERRKRIETCINTALAAAGHSGRVDCRSLEAQRDAALERGDLVAAAALNRAPTVHRGPAVSAGRGRAVPRRVEAVKNRERELAAEHQQLRAMLESQIQIGIAEGRLQTLRTASTSPALRSGPVPHVQPDRRPTLHADRDDDNRLEYSPPPPPGPPPPAPPPSDLAHLADWTAKRRSKPPPAPPKVAPEPRRADRRPAAATPAADATAPAAPATTPGPPATTPAPPATSTLPAPLEGGSLAQPEAGSARHADAPKPRTDGQRERGRGRV